MTAAPVPEPPKTEERLALLETLLDRLPDFFYVSDADLRFHYANRAAAAYFGHTKESIVGRLHRDVDGDDQQAKFYEDALKPILHAGEAVTTDDLPYRRRDGTRGLLRADIVPFRHPSTGEPMMVGISRDVTSDRQVAAEREARAAYERELEVARRVQQSLLPAALPEVPGYAIAARSEPAAFVGGDFFDFIETDDGRTVAVLGDVTGHGVGSALMAGATRAYARVAFSREPFDHAMGLLDAWVHRDLKEGSFVTLAAVEMHAGSGAVNYVSAGHGPVSVVRRGGRAEALPTHTLPLGLGMAPARIDVSPIELDRGAALVLPSDGLFESRNRDGVAHGNDRLTRAASEGRDAAEVLARCFAAEESWRGDLPADDDRTAVVIRHAEG